MYMSTCVCTCTCMCKLTSLALHHLISLVHNFDIRCFDIGGTHVVMMGTQ